MSFTPLIVMMTQDETGRDILVGFCVDVDKHSDSEGKQEMYTNFRKLFEENIKYSKVKNMVQQMLQKRTEVNEFERDRQHANPAEDSSQTTYARKSENKEIKDIKEKILREMNVLKKDDDLASVEPLEPVLPVENLNMTRSIITI